MTPGSQLRRMGYDRDAVQIADATDYVQHFGVFRLRVRIPNESTGWRLQPLLWVGFTAGGPLVEYASRMRYRTSWDLVEDVASLARVLRPY